MSDWLIPYFTFNGNCEEAVKFYQKVLGGESKILHFGDAPPNPAFQVPESAKNLVLHAELRKNGHVIRVEQEPQQTFFSPLYAKFGDRFGINWQLTCKK